MVGNADAIWASRNLNFMSKRPNRIQILNYTLLTEIMFKIPMKKLR